MVVVEGSAWQVSGYCGGPTKPNKKVVGQTLLSLFRNIVLVPSFTDNPTPHLAQLKKLFSGSTIAEALTLADRYASLHCASGDIVVFLSKINELKINLAKFGDPISDVKHALAITKDLKEGGVQGAGFIRFRVL